MCFFNRGDTEGTNSSKILCPMFVYVLFYVTLCHDWFCGLWIICGLMTYVQSKLNIVFSHDVTLCGWLGSKYQLTNLAVMTFLCLIVVQQVSPPPLWHLCDCAWLYLRQGISLLNKAFVWQRASGVSLAIMIFVCLIVVHPVSPSPLWYLCVWLWCIRYLPRRYGIWVSDCCASGISLAVMTFVCLIVVHQVSPSPL